MLAHSFSAEKLEWNELFIPLFNIVSWKNRSAAQTPSAYQQLLVVPVVCLKGITHRHKPCV